MMLLSRRTGVGYRTLGDVRTAVILREPKRDGRVGHGCQRGGTWRDGVL